jgi:hypothetical protein
MKRGDDDATPHRIKQRQRRALTATNILKCLELNEAHTAQSPRGGRFKGGKTHPRHLRRRAQFGNALERLGESLLGAQGITPRDQRRIVGAQATKVADREQGDEEREQGKDHPDGSDCKENLAIHG